MMKLGRIGQVGKMEMILEVRAWVLAYEFWACVP